MNKTIRIRTFGAGQLVVDGREIEAGEGTISALAYLTLHGPATAEQLHEALWPGDHPFTKPAQERRFKVVNAARAVLAQAGFEGALPNIYDKPSPGRYVLNAPVRTDLGQLMLLTKSHPTEALVLGLQTVQGQPFAGSQRWWQWAELDRIKAQDQVGELATIVLERALHGDPVAIEHMDLATKVAQWVQPGDYDVLSLALLLASRKHDARRLMAVIGREVRAVQAADPAGWSDTAAELLETCAALLKQQSRTETAAR